MGKLIIDDARHFLRYIWGKKTRPSFDVGANTGQRQRGRETEDGRKVGPAEKDAEEKSFQRRIAKSPPSFPSSPSGPSSSIQ